MKKISVPDVVAEVQGARKLSHILSDLVKRIAEREIATGDLKNTKDAVKRVKRQLHQSGGAYFAQQPRYDKWLESLRALKPDARPQAIARYFAVHRSMAERAAGLTRYYAALYDGITPGARVLDLACGLNPLGQTWMPWRAASYMASDIYLEMLDFLAEAGALLGTPVETFAHDLTMRDPTPAVQDRADVVLLLKTLPCLDQISTGASKRLLQALDVPEIIVAYPLLSLGGRNKGMAQNYRQSFEVLTRDLGRKVTELSLPYELGFQLSA